MRSADVETIIDPDVFIHDLIQRDRNGNEIIVVHSLCFEEMQEYDACTCTWQSLSYNESCALIEELLGPAAKAPFITAVDWKPGDFAIFDNVQLMHRYENLCI